MPINGCFERAVTKALEIVTKSKGSLRTIMILEWSRTQALFEVEYVVKGEYQKIDFRIDF